MREVVTLQFGSYANFVGAHFWNLQDEAMGRQGEGGAEQNGAGVEESVVMQWRETPGPASTPYCTPRLLAIDYKGCLGPVSLASPLDGHGGIATAPSAMPTWSGPSHVSSAAPLPLNPFLRRLLHPPAPAAHTASSAPASQARGEERHEAAGRHGGGEPREEAEGGAEGGEEEEAEVARGLEGGVGYWTEYLKAHVRPASVLQLPGGWWQGALSPLDAGGYGDWREVGGGREGEEEVEEGVRRVVEECDALQGFSLLLHAASPFASLATRTALHLAAEFPRAPKLLFSLRPPDALLPPATLAPGPHALPGTPSLHDLSSAVSLASLLPLTSLILPLGLPFLSAVLPHVHPSDTALFHSSALLATAIDALSSPFRLAPRAPACASSPVGAVSLRDYCALLSLSSPHGALAFASLALPAQPLHEAGEQEAASGSSPCGMAVLTSDVCSSGEGRGGRGGGSRGGQRGEGMGQQQEGEEVEDLEAGIRAQVVVARGAVGQQATGAEGHTSTVLTPLPPATAAAAIHRALLAARPRLAPPCIAHIAASQQPLAIPLPFPRFFSADVSKYGLILPPSRHRASRVASLAGGAAAAAVAGGVGGGSGGGSGVGMGPDVEWAPVVARAAAGRGGARHGEVLAGALEWVGGARGGAGRQVVAAWGVEGEDVHEMRERVMDVCGKLRGESCEDDSD
ncbi:unnamed protein product [Closterium sp. Naga37s-1]|nr:unnamed protein product [Closterium sp. Naga37s-1]